MRVCKKCNKKKPDEEMIKGNLYRGGIRPICSKCFNKYYYSSTRYKNIWKKKSLED